ncbi:ergothioneine biosynthesis protein EgtB [Novosphingopyxis sp.]|uniref:ergothioneine biosynthesis protein EgtB n=1 Tax=Novosphingopyxis sp. TaxID=2709690 RepID=UPI003B5C6DB9
MSTQPIIAQADAAQLRDFQATRALTLAFAEPLSDADATVQSMDDASPSKWHMAHTSWFFETFVLRDHVPGYEAYDADFAYLFNSYYEAEGDRHDRRRRGMITRPSLDEVRAYRAHVDAAVAEHFDALPDEALTLLELGIHHEQQHQELFQTDLLHLFSRNPTKPAIWPAPRRLHAAEPAPLRWIEGKTGVVDLGHDAEGFAYDCEGPRHEALLTHHALASRCVTNGEWEQFMADGGYDDPRHWLSDGWAWVRAEGIEAPLYWQQREDGGWGQFGLDGMQPVDAAAPVCHVSLYEADAYASWAGARLPTEPEWESAAAGLDAAGGNQLGRAGAIRPAPAPKGDGLAQMFGDVWEWTGSAFRPYPGFKPASGAVGEYNGKFMSGQFVLKGGSCATPRGHVRACYRNFFYPHQRWQFTGLRLAKDL